MAKNSVSDWDTTAANNTDVGGIGIEGSSSIANGNDALQEIMEQVAAYTRRGSDLASAATLNLDSIDSLILNVTGTTTVTAVTLTSGHWRIVRATGAFQMTASASLIVNGSASVNYTTVAGNYLLFEGYGSSVVRVSVLSGVTATGTETLTNKTLTTPTLTLKQSATPTPTAEGDIQWDTDNDVLVIGDGSASKTIAPVTTATAQASTSGDTITFSGIPAWVKQITITFVGVSVSGTGNPAIRIGDSGGLETTGYSSSSSVISAAAVASSSSTSGFHINGASAGNTYGGSVTLTLADAATFTWVAAGVLGTSTNTLTVSGSKALSAALDRVAVQTAGVDTFDAGSINITYH